MLVLSACSSTQPPPTAAERAYAANSVAALNNAPSSATNAVSRQYTGAVRPTRTSYRPQPTISSVINPQDVLDINVFKVKDLSLQKITVESSGIISMPLIGSVKLTGLTISQAEQTITQRLKQYMQDPKVSVTRTDKAISNRVTVEGEVKAPGVFPVKGRVSFLQAIAMAQGLTEVGDSRNILFYRDGGQYNVNLDLVRIGQIPDPGLRGDDRIVVLKDPTKAREKKVLEYLPVITAPFNILRGF